MPGASAWSMASATMGCAGGSTQCTGTARSSAAGSDGPTELNGANGARGPPEGVSTTTASCAGESACTARTSSPAGSGQVVADMVAESQNDAAEQAEQQAVEAEQLATQAAEVAAGEGATAEQKKAATNAAAAATQAREAATEAAELAASRSPTPRRR